MQNQFRPQVPQPAQFESHQQIQDLQSQMKEMREQNLRLMQMLEHRSAKVHTQHQYSHDDLKAYFMHKNAGATKLDAEIANEQSRLKKLEALKAETPTSVPGSELLVQLAEGSEDSAALPLYNQHAEQAWVEMEDLQKRAMEDMVDSSE